MKIDSYLPTNNSWLHRIFRKLFPFETMSGNGACPVYLERWTIGQLFGCGAYLHHFLGDDWALDPHDHPRRFISIGLRGWYYEDVFTGNGEIYSTHRFQAPWIRSFPAEHLHRVRAVECGNVWTLVIVLRKSRGWGFLKDGEWISFKQYVFGGKFRKAC
jgi:hypothetical protein